ncbi:hypothetical protein B0H19DRAFT_368300 [Mycena capillaripes]|nr:hypothetical protein B0H19DRAFT_368300 [Mycena capillaripes]
MECFRLVFAVVPQIVGGRSPQRPASRTWDLICWAPGRLHCHKLEVEVDFNVQRSSRSPARSPHKGFGLDYVKLDLCRYLNPKRSLRLVLGRVARIRFAPAGRSAIDSAQPSERFLLNIGFSSKGTILRTSSYKSAGYLGRKATCPNTIVIVGSCTSARPLWNSPRPLSAQDFSSFRNLVSTVRHVRHIIRANERASIYIDRDDVLLCVVFGHRKALDYRRWSRWHIYLGISALGCSQSLSAGIFSYSQTAGNARYLLSFHPSWLSFRIRLQFALTAMDEESPFQNKLGRVVESDGVFSLLTNREDQFHCGFRSCGRRIITTLVWSAICYFEAL